MAIALGYQLKSVERHRFHIQGHFCVASCAGQASLNTRSLLRFNHHQGILIDQLETPIVSVAHVDVLNVSRIAAGVRIAATHFRSCNDAGCPCRTCVFPSKPEGNTHQECDKRENGRSPAP